MERAAEPQDGDARMGEGSSSGEVPRPFSDDELAAAIKVIEALGKDEAMYQSKPIRGLRKALAPIIERTTKKMYISDSGQKLNPDDYAAQRQAKATAAAKRNAQRLRDQEYINKTKLRAARIAKLSDLLTQGGTDEHATLPLIPDGWVDDDEDSSPLAEGNARKRALLTDGTAADTTATSTSDGASEETSPSSSSAAVSSSSAGAAGAASEPADGAAVHAGSSANSSSSIITSGSSAGSAAAPPPASLSSQRACYICKRRFGVLHHFYDTLCPPCAELNWRKRNQVADLRGRVVLVTGSRVKIGFQCVLRLLRCGATVIATSRFPVDAAQRFGGQADYDAWKDRLHLYGLDLRDMRALESFCSLLNASYPRLDAIVNNACQTVRRPPAYFAGLIAGETAPLQSLPDRLRPVVQRDYDYRASLARAGLLAAGPQHAPRLLADTIDEMDGSNGSSNSGSSSSALGAGAHPLTATARAAAGDEDAALNEMASLPTSDGEPLSSAAANASVPAPSAQMSQLAVLKDDHLHDASLFPQGKVDVNKQQVDLRDKNSWTMKLEEVETPELAEVFLINTMAPMVLNGRLKPLMMRGRAIPDPLPTRPARASAADKLKSLAELLLEERQQQEADAAAGSSSSSSASSSGRHSGTGAARRDHKIKGGGPMMGEVAPPVPAELCRFIVNVSAMEGKFHRHKTANHPHTNAAKAALNMMTRTSSQDYAKDFIYMTSVDTGWINDENPILTAARTAARHNFQTPLDEIDAAARVLDPILEPLAEAQSAAGDGFCCPVYGGFYKDYRVTEW